MFELCNSDIDFLPSEMMNEDRTTGWLAINLMKVIKVWLWLFRNYGLIIENKHDDVSVDHTKYNAKMCSACLKLRNENIPLTLSEKKGSSEQPQKFNDNEFKKCAESKN